MRDAAFGTMTVEVHKDLIAVERAKYKRAVTDLAAQADQLRGLIDELRPDAEKWRDRAARELQRGQAKRDAAAKAFAEATTGKGRK